MANQKTAAKKTDSLSHIQTVVEHMPKYESRQVQHWTFENISTRDLAARLNKLSLEGVTIFSVHSSTNVGGNYEVLYYNTVSVMYVDGNPKV
jgi:hypothetical protein